MLGMLAELADPHEVLGVNISILYLASICIVSLNFIRPRMEPPHQVESHWQIAKGTFPHAMDEPCLHVPHDHLHVGQALVPTCR